MTNAEARCNKSLRPRKPEGSLGRTAQDVHLDSHTAPELCTEDNDDVPDVPELSTTINQIHLSVEEVKNTLTKLSTAKATGRDQIHNFFK